MMEKSKKSCKHLRLSCTRLIKLVQEPFEIEISPFDLRLLNQSLLDSSKIESLEFVFRIINECEG